MRDGMPPSTLVLGVAEPDRRPRMCPPYADASAPARRPSPCGRCHTAREELGVANVRLLRHHRQIEAAIAIVSVVSSAVVAIVVAVIANRGQTTRLALQISAERMNELRSVLDEAASALRGAVREMNGIVSLLDRDLSKLSATALRSMTSTRNSSRDIRRPVNSASGSRCGSVRPTS
jgi:hypothetical protein